MDKTKLYETIVVQIATALILRPMHEPARKRMFLEVLGETLTKLGPLPAAHPLHRIQELAHQLVDAKGRPDSVEWRLRLALAQFYELRAGTHIDALKAEARHAR